MIPDRRFEMQEKLNRIKRGKYVGKPKEIFTIKTTI